MEICLGNIMRFIGPELFVWYNKHTDQLSLFFEIDDVVVLARMYLAGWIYIGEF